MDFSFEQKELNGRQLMEDVLHVGKWVYTHELSKCV